MFAGVALQLMMLVLALLVFLRNQEERQLRESIIAAGELIRRARSLSAYRRAIVVISFVQHQYTSLRRGPTRFLVSIPLQVPLALFAAFLLLTIPFGVQLTPQENFADVLGLRLTMTPPGWQIVDATCWLTIVFLTVWLFRFVWEPSYDVWSIITHGDGAGERTLVYSVVDTIAQRALMIIGGLVLTFTGLAFANGIVSPSNPPRPVEPRESPRLVGSVSPFWQTFEATFNAPRTLGMDDSAVVSVGFRMQRSHESTWLAHESKFGPNRIGHGKYHAYLVAPAFRVDDVAADPVDVRYTGTTCWSWTIQPKREGVQVIQAVIEHDVNGHRQTRWESVGSNIEVSHRIAAETWLKSSAPFLTFALGFLSIVLGLFRTGGGRDTKSRGRRRQGEGAEEDSDDDR